MALKVSADIDGGNKKKNKSSYHFKSSISVLALITRAISFVHSFTAPGEIPNSESMPMLPSRRVKSGESRRTAMASVDGLNLLNGKLILSMSSFKEATV